MAGVFNGRLSEGVDYAGGILDSVICVGIQNAPPSVFQKRMRTTSRTNLDRVTSGDMRILNLQSTQYCKRWVDRLGQWG